MARELSNADIERLNQLTPTRLRHIGFAIIFALFSLTGAPAAGSPWQIQREVNRFTDEQSVIAVQVINDAATQATVKIFCTDGRKLAYEVFIGKAFGSEDIELARTLNPAGLIFGFAGPATKVDVRTDGSDIKVLYAPLRYNNLVTLSSSDLRRDLGVWLDDAAEKIALRELGMETQLATTEGVADLAAANRVRIRLHLTQGDILLDLDQTKPEPIAVFAKCGLSKSNLASALTDKAVTRIHEIKQANAKRAAQEAEDELYNTSKWPPAPLIYVPGRCRVQIDTAVSEDTCSIRLSEERLEFSGPPQLVPVNLRISGDKAFGLVDDPRVSPSLRTGMLNREGDCWRGGRFLICARPNP